MNIFKICASVVALVSLTLFTHAFASPHPLSDPQNVVNAIIKHAKHSEIKQLESFVDFEQITNSALGSYLKKISSADRSKIQSLLQKIIAKKAYPNAPQFFKDVTVQFTDQSSSRDRLHLSSSVKKGTSNAQVEYWLAPHVNAEGMKSYQLVDLAIDGRNWVKNIRNQFKAILKKHDSKTLIAKLETQLKKLN